MHMVLRVLQLATGDGVDDVALSTRVGQLKTAAVHAKEGVPQRNTSFAAP